MEKIIDFLRSIYKTDNKIMLYVYIGIAAVTVILILTLLINWMVTSIKRKKQNKKVEPVISTIEPILTESKHEEVKEKLKEEVMEITKDITPIADTKEIKPIEKIKNYDKPLEEKVEVKEPNTPVQMSGAADLLDEFLLDDNSDFGITADELNMPLPDNIVSNHNEPDYSTVFLDKKDEEKSHTEVNLVLTPIIPDSVESLEPSKTIDELFEKEKEEPEIVKPTLDEVLAKMKANTEEVLDEKIINEEVKEDELSLVQEDVIEKKVEESAPIVEIKPEPDIILERKETKEENISDEKLNIKEDKSLDTMIDIFSHEAIKDKQEEPELSENNNRVVLTVDDLKNKLNFLKTKTNEEEFDKEYDDIFKQIGIEEQEKDINENIPSLGK